MDNDQLPPQRPESPVVPQDTTVPKARKILYAVFGLLLFGGIVSYAYFVQYHPEEKGYDWQVSTTPFPSFSGTPYETYLPPYPEYNDIFFKESVEVAWNDKLVPIQCSGGSCYQATLNAGIATSGSYKGQTVYLQLPEGPGAGYLHVIIQGKDRVYLQNIKGIHDIPTYLNFPLKSGYRLKKSYGTQVPIEEMKGLTKVFTDPVMGDVYRDDIWKCFFVKLPDHTVVAYDLELTFVNEENGDLKATLNGNIANKEAYEFFRIMGCGALCRTLNIKEESELRPAERFEVAGTTTNSEDLYRIRNSQDPVLKELYNDKNTVAYYSDQGFQQLPQNKYTYEQFIGYNPLLYWKDPLGRWVEFKNKRFLMAAEMCKPVIYLYPQQTTDLQVRVYPNGGFTYTDPKYEDGWRVRAYPNGKLMDLRTGKSHDYLFWEGIGLNYPEDDKGWVVKREDISSFIEDKLAYLGLQGRELADFKEYWVHRLIDKPYYKLSFLTQEQFNEIAPLELSQNPNVAIRILMTAEGMDSFRSIQPQDLKPAPERIGFTLIEWGGVVLK